MNISEIQETAAQLEALLEKTFAQIEALHAKAQDLRRELKLLKNRENKPKGDRRITNATICRLLNISESRLKARLLRLGVMHKPWGYLEVHDTWFGKVKLTGLLRKDGKTANVWVWTEEGKEKFIKLHNEQSWK
jgi:hypothetical protein